MRGAITGAYQQSSEYRTECDLSWHPAIRWQPKELQLKTHVPDGFWSEEMNATLAVSNTVKKTSKKGKKSLGKEITMDGKNCDAGKDVKGKQKELATLHQHANISNGAVVKGKDTEADTNALPPTKKFKGPEGCTDQRGPLGLKWNGKNYSCGYDSFFTIIYNIWKDDVNLSGCSNLMDVLCEKFANVAQGTLTFEGA